MLSERLKLSEIHAVLPDAAPGAGVTELGDKLHARAGYVRPGIEGLLKAGAARRGVGVDSERFWRVPDIGFKDEVVRPGMNEKPPDMNGDVDREGGGKPARKDGPLKLYGEDKNRRRVKLETIRMMDTLKRCLARELVIKAIERCDASASDRDVGLPVEGLLLAEAEAHAEAAEMLRARTKRLSKG